MSKVRERKSRRKSQKKLRTVSSHQQTNPDQLEKQLDLSIEHHQSGRLAEAEACYQQVLQLQPNHADAWHLLGVIAYQQEQYSTAIERINRALQLNQKAANFRNSLGSVYQKPYKFDQALECYQKAIQLQPDYFEAHNNIGLVYQEQGQLVKAIEYYQQAIKLYPNYADAHNSLAYIFQLQGKLKEAIQSLQKTLQLQPDHHQACNNMARVFRSQAHQGCPWAHWLPVTTTIQGHPGRKEQLSSGAVMLRHDQPGSCRHCTQARVAGDGAFAVTPVSLPTYPFELGKRACPPLSQGLILPFTGSGGSKVCRRSRIAAPVASMSLPVIISSRLQVSENWPIPLSGTCSCSHTWPPFSREDLGVTETT